MRRIEVERSTYLDSVRLMRISKKASEANGIRNAVVAMATDSNLLLMKEVGFDPSRLSGVSGNDLLIAIEAEDEAALEAALALVRSEIQRGTARPEEPQVPKSLHLTLREYPGINLIFISVPGQFAAYEAHKALLSGKHVMVFSDNVSIEDEIRLKRLACEKGLLLMGPDCGTAIIGGVGLGFANNVPRGNIGIVSASGTGAQEVSSILARSHHLGISQLIGTGGRDVSEAIGGLTTIMALRALIDDQDTDVIIIISKLPDDRVAKEILDIARQGGKPCIIYFAGHSEIGHDGNLFFTRTLAQTALEAACAVAGEAVRLTSPHEEGIKKNIKRYKGRLPRSRRFLRGLFCGGTLAQEAMFILGPSLKSIHTNIKLPGFEMLEDPANSLGHTLVDLGDDAFTRGRAHPMIDQSYRLTRIAREAQDPATAVILLDVVLGFGCNEEPGREIARTLREVFGKGQVKMGCPMVIASICGTHEDPQDFFRQREALEAVGVLVAENNQRACEQAEEALKG